MKWERDRSSNEAEFILKMDIAELSLLNIAMENLHKAVSLNREIEIMGDLSDMKPESRKEFKESVAELRKQFEEISQHL